MLEQGCWDQLEERLPVLTKPLTAWEAVLSGEAAQQQGPGSPTNRAEKRLKSTRGSGGRRHWLHVGDEPWEGGWGVHPHSPSLIQPSHLQGALGWPYGL